MLNVLKMTESIVSMTEALNDTELGRLIRCMWRYAWSGQDSQPKGNERFVWKAMMNDIDNQAKEQEEKSRKTRDSISKRWEKSDTNVYDRIRTNTNVYDRTKEKEEEEKTEKEKKVAKEKSKEEKEEGEKEIAREARAHTPTRTGKSIPPTLDEVKAYCKEKNNGVDAEKWYCFYASKGWMVGSNKMTDWHMAVATWARSEKERQPAPSVEPPSFDLDEFYNLALERGKRHE